MSRRYPVTFEKISISAAQDLFELYFGASIYKCLRVIRQWLDVADTTLPASGFLGLRSRVLGATVTHGSLGAAAQIGNKLAGDTAASFTANANNTTKATSNGTVSVEYEGGFHLYQGHEFMFDSPPVIIGGAGASFVFELLDAPSAAIKFSGGLLVEEMG